MLDIVNKFNSIDGIINLASDNSGLGSAKNKNNFSKFTRAYNNNLLAPVKIVLTLRKLLQKIKLEIIMRLLLIYQVFMETYHLNRLFIKMKNL